MVEFIAKRMENQECFKPQWFEPPTKRHRILFIDVFCPAETLRKKTGNGNGSALQRRSNVM